MGVLHERRRNKRVICICICGRWSVACEEANTQVIRNFFYGAPDFSLESDLVYADIKMP